MEAHSLTVWGLVLFQFSCWKKAAGLDLRRSQAISATQLLKSLCIGNQAFCLVTRWSWVLGMLRVRFVAVPQPLFLPIQTVMGQLSVGKIREDWKCWVPWLFRVGWRAVGMMCFTETLARTRVWTKSSIYISAVESSCSGTGPDGEDSSTAVPRKKCVLKAFPCVFVFHQQWAQGKLFFP